MGNLRVEIDRLVSDYLDGLYNGDLALWRGVFHPDCKFHYLSDGKLEAVPVEEIYARVAARQSPASQGLGRHDFVHMVDMAGPEMALVKVSCAMPPRFFTDYLTLLRTADGWRIVTKTYRVENR
jgi:GNAT superfamily N-acetyltransferase